MSTCVLHLHGPPRATLAGAHTVGLAAREDLDKLEGFTFDAEGKAFAVTDNDGVDDSSGETLFWEVNLQKTN